MRRIERVAAALAQCITSASIIAVCATPAVVVAQNTPVPGANPVPGAPDTLPNGPQIFQSEGQKFRVVPTKGLSRPFALAFLPNGDILITERAGRLRIVRMGVLDPNPITGVPEVLDLKQTLER